MEDSIIRWTGNTWNFFTGCTEVSSGCDHCYARVIAEKFRGKAFPHGFAPTWKPQKLADPEKWAASRVFVNSMSDCFHREFSYDMIAAGFAVMLRERRHQYQILTKRPERMRAFVSRWLAEVGLRDVPDHIWLGVTIESDRYAYRADVLREIPVPVRFISAEPLLDAAASLDLAGIAWLIVGGESGPGYRPMDHQWARDLLAKARASKTAYFFKQSAAPRTEMGMELDGRRYEEFPRPAPTGGPPPRQKRGLPIVA